ncbi:UPF0319 protein [Vibrio zhanjiangensis]|uniref:UPF0319 protein GCM10007938_28670 n=1 Tax=Vibrio zhanjiangensis TaxID=1046128 RepID=A0ABQ6F2R8_9VIBR|nr:DUF2057 family protein [Vibrio zhanjiangensis]GLT19085.1 UPF0319 protein [Vibrio zhanjiangensis]
MNIKTTFLAVAALTVSSLAVADVTITVPDTIDVLVVNDGKPEFSGSFFSATKTLVLPDGENQLLFRYQPYFTQGNDRIILESDPIIAKFNTHDAELSFKLPKYKDRFEGEKDIKNVQWQLTTASGSALAVTEDKLVKDGMQIGRNFKLELADYNRRGGVAAVAPIAAVSQPSAPKVTNETLATDSTAEEMLHFWYNKADAETQSRFKQFLLSNDS